MIGRRDFITLLGGAAAWPIAAQAQQAMPVIGWLHLGLRDEHPFQRASVAGGPAYLLGENFAHARGGECLLLCRQCLPGRADPSVSIYGHCAPMLCTIYALVFTSVFQWCATVKLCKEFMSL
jgi:hypothetical protein